MTQTFGNEIDANDDLWPHRLNQKMLWSGDGADIAALDFTTNLVSRYPFAGDGNDAQGSNNLTANGTPTYVKGRYGQAASLNGSTQYYTAATSAIHDKTTGNFAFTFWFKLAALGARQEIVNKRDTASGANAGYSIYISSTNKLVAEYSAGTLITATGITTLTTGIWYFAAVVYNRSGNMTVYIGTATGGGITQEAATAINATTITNTRTFAVGRMNGAAPGNYFNGQIDQVQAFSAAPSSLNILQVFDDLHAGQLVHCEKASGSFEKGWLYERDEENTLFRTVPAGGVVLINADDTDGTLVSENTTKQISKTYTLAANKYSKIIAIADLHVNHQQAQAGDNAFAIGISIGATVKEVTHSREDPTGSIGDNDYMTLRVSAVLQAGGAIDVYIVAAGVQAAHDMQCHSLYIYGVL